MGVSRLKSLIGTGVYVLLVLISKIWDTCKSFTINLSVILHIKSVKNQFYRSTAWFKR